MKIVYFNEEEGVLKAEPQTIDDLWYLSKIIDVGNTAAGSSYRRFKVQDINRPSSGEKKKIFVQLLVENAEFAQAVNKLRITGKILGGSPEEFVQLGEHHTLDVEIGGRVELKKRFSVYDKKVLEQARKKTGGLQAKIIVVDDEKATIAELSAQGIRFLYELKNDANKRDLKNFDSQKKSFLAELVKALGAKNIVAGPGFTKDEFKKFVSQKHPELLKQISFEHTSNAEKSGVYELLKNGLVERLIGEQKLEEEFKALEEFKKRIARGGLACYGVLEVKKVVEIGSVSDVLVLDELLRVDKTVQETIEQAEGLKANTIVFDSSNEAGQEFKIFQIAALLRYKTSYE